MGTGTPGGGHPHRPRGPTRGVSPPEVVARPTTAVVWRVVAEQHTRSAAEIAPTQVTGEGPQTLLGAPLRPWGPPNPSGTPPDPSKPLRSPWNTPGTPLRPPNLPWDPPETPLGPLHHPGTPRPPWNIPGIPL